MSAEQTGLRILAALDQLGDEPARAGEELVRELMAFYGEGLTRIVAQLPDEVLAELLADQVTAGLLALHDLNPEELDTRIGRALAAVPAYPAEVLGFDPTEGRLRLRLSGSCGCGSTEQAAREALESALGCWAPEVAAVDLERAPKLLQIGRAPVEVGR